MAEVTFNTSIERGKGFVHTNLGATDDFSKGEVILIGTNLVCICLEEAAGATVRAASIAAGSIPKPDRCAVLYEHEDITIKKSDSVAFSAGDEVFWDVTDNEVNKSAGGNYRIGVALEDAAEADKTVRISFDGDIIGLADLSTEAGAFFTTTNLSGAEAEKLRDGSDADALHVHNTVNLSKTVTITAAEIKALRASPKTLVAAPGAGKVLEFVSILLKLTVGTEVLTESTYNLAVKYANGSGAVVSGAIESTNFINAAVDTYTRGLPIGDAIVAAASAENKALVLHNTGAGEIAGNSSNDAAITAIVTYRLHDMT